MEEEGGEPSTRGDLDTSNPTPLELQARLEHMEQAEANQGNDETEPIYKQPENMETGGEEETTQVLPEVEQDKTGESGQTEAGSTSAQVNTSVVETAGDTDPVPPAAAPSSRPSTQPQHTPHNSGVSHPHGLVERSHSTRSVPSPRRARGNRPGLASEASSKPSVGLPSLAPSQAEIGRIPSAGRHRRDVQTPRTSRESTRIRNVPNVVRMATVTAASAK